MNFRDVEQLSSYLDGQLSPSEVTRLEARLAVDEPLRRVLDDLRISRGLLRRVPRRKAPRNFTLSPFNARVRAPQPRSIPVLRNAGAIASLLFALTLGLNTLGPTAARTFASAPAPALGMGGGMGGGAPEEVPPELFAAAPAAEGTPGPAEAVPQADMATAEALAKAAPAEPAMEVQAQQPSVAPVPPVWVMLLALAGIVLLGLAWYLDRYTSRNFRSRVLEK